jgi:SAM-dependent methyltransferase
VLALIGSHDNGSGGLIVKRFVNVFKAGGVAGVLSAAARRIRTPHARSFPQCREMVSDGIGIEIGGPSPIFAWGGLIPLYPVARRIDNVNFASSTIWEDATREGDTFHFYSRKAPGRQFLAEGADVRVITSGKYDFVLSSHMLEHTANPLRALDEWKRLLKSGGALVLVIPARDGAFDHRRPITTLAHLIEDFDKNVSEDDLTHLAEVLQLHDLSRDPGVTDARTFHERAERNAEFRSIHHHVFDTRLAADTVFHAGFELLAVEPLKPYHIVMLARKPLVGVAASPFDEVALREVLRKSPFQSDRQGL